MIILPSSPGVRTVTPRLIDAGLVQRPGRGGGPATRIDLPGSRYAADVVYPKMDADTARVFISRLLRAKSQGLRMPYPLSGVSQGSPGNPTVNGSGAGGTSLPVTGATAGYQVKEGYWVTVVDGDGTHFLHNVSATVTLAGGAGTISVWPPLRGSFPNGSLVLLAEPKIEGIVTSDINWPLPHTKTVTLEFSIEEAD